MAYWSRKPRPSDTPRIHIAQPPIPQGAMTAAVQAMTPAWGRTQRRLWRPWHDRADFFCRNLGLVRFANTLQAQSAARVDMRVEQLVDPIRDEWEPVDENVDAVPAKVLRDYNGTDAETAGDLVARHVWHYKASGQCYLVVDTDGQGGLDWSIRSMRAVQWRTRDVLVLDVPGGSVTDGTARVVAHSQVRRLWVPDPDWPLLATSHMEGVLADCERYWALARRIRREAESALTNGIMFTPEYAHEYEPTAAGNPASSTRVSRLDRDYYRIAELSFHDDDSVAAVAPLSMHYGAVDQRNDPAAPQFVYPGKVLDPNGIAYREEAAENIARGLDLPTQIALSKEGDANHWSAWLFREGFVTSSMAPLLDRVMHADLTVAMLRPSLDQYARLGRWNGNPNLYRVGYDPTPIIVHPDRAASAVQLFGLGLLAAVPVLEANGFDGSDAPEPAELARIVETLAAIRGRQEGMGFASGGMVGPGNVRELPPAPALAAVGPYPTEIGTWLEG